MAKRRPKEKKRSLISYETLKQHEALLSKLFWAVTIILSALFGYSYASPVIAEGQVWDGILVGLAYGGGAFIAIAISFFLNRKLKGL